MTVFINDKPVSVFYGATLKETILKHSKKSYAMLLSGYLGIFDRFGNLTETDGPVADGQRFFLRVIR